MPANETRRVLEDLLVAVDDEHSGEAQTEPQWQRLEHPVLTPLANGDLLLRAIDLDSILKEGAQTVVRLDGREFRAEVVGLGLGELTLHLRQCDATSVRECQVRVPVADFLSTLRDFLAEQLSLHLSTSPATKAPVLANALATPWPARSLTGIELTYLLGAPGSGKTSRLVARALDLARCGEKVAVVSYTNAAADIIFARMATHREELGHVKVTRLGVTERSLSIEDQAASAAISVSASMDGVEADVLVTTAYRALGCAREHARDFSAVLIDEASTMPLALAWAAALLARTYVGLYGDPYQLGPIALGTVDSDRTLRQRFGTSPFEVEGVMEAAGRHNAARVLSGQHRLPSSLASAVLAPLYANSRGASSRTEEKQTPWGTGSLLYVDTTAMNPTCVRVSSSRQNVFHASLVVECVRALLEQDAVRPDDVEQDLLIVTPYRAQRALITRLLADKGWFSDQQVRRLVTTIHRAQGSERDFVLVDTVEAPLSDRPGESMIGRLWDGKGWQSPGARLLTTALTRARAQALVVMRRDVTGTAYDAHAPDAKALPRLNAMLDQWGNPADIALPASGHW